MADCAALICQFDHAQRIGLNSRTTNGHCCRGGPRALRPKRGKSGGRHCRCDATEIASVTVPVPLELTHPEAITEPCPGGGLSGGHCVACVSRTECVDRFDVAGCCEDVFVDPLLYARVCARLDEICGKGLRIKGRTPPTIAIVEFPPVRLLRRRGEFHDRTRPIRTHPDPLKPSAASLRVDRFGPRRVEPRPTHRWETTRHQQASGLGRERPGHDRRSLGRVVPAPPGSSNGRGLPTAEGPQRDHR